jgi:hypothetical protein
MIVSPRSQRDQNHAAKGPDMTSDDHNLRPADPRGLERWREEAEQREEEFARERRREERDIAGLRIRARAEVVAPLRGASAAGYEPARLPVRSVECSPLALAGRPAVHISTNIP